MINRRRDIYDNDKDYNNNKVGDDHTDDNEETLNCVMRTKTLTQYIYLTTALINGG